MTVFLGDAPWWAVAGLYASGLGVAAATVAYIVDRLTRPKGTR